MVSVIDLEVFEQIKQEHREGRTANYSALLHDIQDVEIILSIIAAKDYGEFCDKVAEGDECTDKDSGTSTGQKRPSLTE